MIQMTTATTALQSIRSIENIYTSGRNDGTKGLHPGHTPYLNLDDWGSGTMGKPSGLYQHCYPDFNTYWPIGEGYFNTRYVWAHSEFTPRQTMRGKMALYAYLYSIGEKHLTKIPENPIDKSRTKQSFKIYPNPADSNLFYIETKRYNNCELQIINMNGQIIRRQQIQDNKKINISTSDFARGIYLIKIQNQVKKLVVD